jgi:hypothetical protein
MKIYKTRYETIFSSNPPSHLHLLIEMGFYNWWDLKVYKNDFRQLHIVFHPKTTYITVLSSFLIKEVEKIWELKII